MNRSNRIESALFGARVGALAGLCVGVLDVASTVLWLSSLEDQRRLVAVVLLLCASVSALIGAAWGALFESTHTQSIRLHARRAIAVSIAPAAVVGHLLFTGGKMRRLALRALLEPLVMLVLCALFAAAIVSASRWIARTRRASSLRRALVTALLAVGAMALHGLDHRVLPRLYEYLHAVLGAGTLACAAGAIALWAQGASGGWRSAAPLLLAPIGALASLSYLARWDNVRAEVFGTHAPYARHIALALQSVAAPRRAVDARALAAIERERVAREERARAAERDPTLPRVAGAHVLLVTVDAMRADRLSAERTPALWALAARSTRFARAYSQAPHSSYSITTLHTGEFLHETVQLGQPQPLPTLAASFAAAGYRTVALYTNGIFFTEGERLTPYRDRHLDFARSEHRDLDSRATTDAAIRELDESLSRGEPPTLLWAHYFDAHEPYRGQGDSSIARYDSALATVDREVARLLDHARRALHRPVIVALAADHGEEFGEHGGVYHGSALYEEQVRVPLVISLPEGVVAPSVIEAPVGLVDVAPTLLALAGVARPASMRGRDLRPWIARRTQASEPVFSAVNTRTMVVRWPRKLVADLRWGVRELYDLRDDPSERRNIASVDAAGMRALEAEIQGWISALGGERAMAARVRMGDRGTVDALVARALDARRSVTDRREAIEALATLRDRAVSARLEPLLRAEDRSLRIECAVAVALATSEDRAAVRVVLLDAVEDDAPTVRARAALALASMGVRNDPVERALIALARAGDEGERSAAIDAMASLGARAAAAIPAFEAVLMEAMEDDHLRYRAALALGASQREGALRPLIALAREDRAEDTRAWAAAGLAFASAGAASDALRERLRNDPSAQRFAASALLRVLGRTEQGWDARWGEREGLDACGSIDDEQPWVTLGSRACRVRSSAVIGRAGAAGLGRVWLRANGSGSLVLRCEAQEVARVSLGSQTREWRLDLRENRCHHAVIRVESDGAAWLSYALWLGES